MDFLSYCSDDYVHNAATIFENMKIFINLVYEGNLFIRYGIIYDTTYRCSKQYILANELRRLSVLSLTYRVIIDSCINAPVHKKRKIYGISGSYK